VSQPSPEDVELVARASQVDAMQWDMLCAKYPAAADSIRRVAEKQLAALASAGRLRDPGGDEWSVRYLRDGYVVQRHFTQAGARQFVEESHAELELVHRWVGPWQPTEDTQ
jgi:hypothetical protein